MASSSPQIIPLPGGFTNPMTTAGDMIVGGVAGAASRLAGPGLGALLGATNTGIPEWTGGYIRLADDGFAGHRMIFRDSALSPLAYGILQFTLGVGGKTVDIYSTAAGRLTFDGSSGVIVQYRNASISVEANAGYDGHIGINGTGIDYFWYMRAKTVEETDVFYLHNGAAQDEGQYEMQLEYVFAGPTSLYPADADKQNFNVGGNALVTGNMDVNGVYKVDTVQVVGSQNTGWTIQTATASKADLGATPTAAALASWASAIQAMLATHGLVAQS